MKTSCSRSAVCSPSAQCLFFAAISAGLALGCSERNRRGPESSGAPRTEATAGITFPIVFDSSCEGEDCEATNFAAVACASAVLRGATSDSSEIVARIPVGDTVHVIARSLHVLQPGIVIVRQNYTLANDSEDGPPRPRRDTLRFAARDTLYLVRYLELGAWVWSYKGALHSGHEFWGGSTDVKFGGMSEDTTYAVRRSVPRIAHWWHVQPSRGAAGWWHGEAGPALESTYQHLRWGGSCAGREVGSGGVTDEN